MKTKALKTKCDQTLKRHSEEIYALAEEARALILPYFQKRGWDYTTGNGTWLITKEITVDKEVQDKMIADSELPKWLSELLYLEVAHGAYLGFYINDIKREEL